MSVPKHPLGPIVYPEIPIFFIYHSNRNMSSSMFINGSSFHINHGQMIYRKKVCPVQKGHRQVTLRNSKECI